MEQTKNYTPYLIGGALLVALVVGLLVARSTTGERTARGSAEAAASTPAGGEAAKREVRFKVPVTNLHAWIGPNDALVTMVEWCDLRGPACREAEAPLKELMKEYEGKLRWVHYSVSDSTRPDEAKRIHQFARAVYEDEKDSAMFWKLRELMLATPDGVELDDARLRQMGKEVGFDYDKVASRIREGKFAMVVALDMGLGERFGVRQLPTIFVNGRPTPGGESAAATKRAVKALIEEELVHAQQVLAQGVDRAKLYEKIVEDGLWSTDDTPAKRQAHAAEMAQRRQSRKQSLKFDEP